MEIQKTRGVVVYGMRQRKVGRWRFFCQPCDRPGPWGALRDAHELGRGHIELFHPAVAEWTQAPIF